LLSRRSSSSHRVFGREDLDAYLDRPVAENSPHARVEALYCRVSGSTGPEASLANQESMLRESACGAVYHRVFKDRGSGVRETRAGLDRMLDDAAKGQFMVVRVVRVVWRDRLARFAGGVDRAVRVGGGRYGRGSAGWWRHVAGGGADG
jgi:predicted site-specific integrase-resolvase